MSAVIFSTNEDERNVSTYSNHTSGSYGPLHRGMRYNFNYVSKVYVGGSVPQLVFEDVNAPQLISTKSSYAALGTNAPLIKKFIENGLDYQLFESDSSETNPRSADQFVSSTILCNFTASVLAEYSDGRSFDYYDVDSNFSADKYEIANLYVNDTQMTRRSAYESLNDQPAYQNIANYVLPDNSTGNTGIINNVSLITPAGTTIKTIYEYQTCSPYALFGLTGCDHDELETAAPYITRTGNNVYSFYDDSVVDPESATYKYLVIRPLKNCTMTLGSQAGFFYKAITNPTENTAYALNATKENFGNFPTSHTMMVNNPTAFSESNGFTQTTEATDDISIALTAGVPILLGFTSSGSFSFDTTLSVNPEEIYVTADSAYKNIAVTTDADITWKANVYSGSDWITITSTDAISGITGSKSFTVKLEANTNTTKRTGGIEIMVGSVTKATIYVEQAAKTASFTYTETNGWDHTTEGTDANGNAQVEFVTGGSEYAAPYDHVATIVPSANGTLTVDILYVDEQDDTLTITPNANNYGVQLSTSSTYSSSGALAFSTSSSGQAITKTINVTAGTTYYLIVHVAAGVSDDIRDNTKVITVTYKAS